MRRETPAILAIAILVSACAATPASVGQGTPPLPQEVKAAGTPIDVSQCAGQNAALS